MLIVVLCQGSVRHSIPYVTGVFRFCVHFIRFEIPIIFFEVLSGLSRRISKLIFEKLL